MNHEKQKGRKQFEQFFAVLFRPNELVELRFIESWTSNGKRRRRVAGPAKWLPAHKVNSEYDGLVEFAESERANVYFGVCPRQREADSHDETIKTVRCVWCDVDDVTVEETQRRWKAVEIPRPSIVVSSGNGIHAYWLLNQDLASAEERNRLATMLPAFYRAFGGDHVQNLSRVMRPAGTFNYKGARNGRPPLPCSLVFCDPERRYSLAAFATWMQFTESSIRHGNAVSPVEAKKGLSSDTVLACRAGAAALASRLDMPSQDRSRRDFAVVCDLLRLGLRPEEIWSLVADKSKFESNGRPYFDLTITNAERMTLLAASAPND